MTNVSLSQNQWQKIKTFLQTQVHAYIGQDDDCRKFFEALIWMARSGAQWRLLPKSYGHWNTVYKRFARWEKQGIFKAMIEYFAQDPDLRNLMLDSTITRAHPCAAGALKKTEAKRSRRLVALEEVSAPKYTCWSIPKAIPSNSF